jgi:putative hydrolase of HD superfamily
MSAAEAVVQEQLDAYNARDIERFMRCWVPDCRYYAFPDTLLAEGREQVRTRHVGRFREPDLHGLLLQRMTLGSMVVDCERVTRNFPEGRGVVEVIAIYEVADGLIVRAWFRIGEPQLA